jgi:hypothetical protein
MTDHRYSLESDYFNPVPDVPHNKGSDARLQDIIPGAEAEQWLPLAKYLGDVNIRKKPGLFVRLSARLLTASAPFALAVLSWFLGGNAVWGSGTFLLGLPLIILPFTALKTVSELQPRHYLM